LSAEENNTAQHIGAARETFESIWIAIVMAFVLRAFVVEAFVIPTGSMAPRLMGQHWQFDCPACGYHYAFGLTSAGNQATIDISNPSAGPPAICPNCHYDYRFGRAYAFSGDRVLVLKYLYQFRQPRPWDVVVFKNPQDNDVNYIKRLIGLPGQMIEIVHGDIFFRDGQDFNGDGVIDQRDFDDPRAAAGCPWQLLRKQPATQQVMWQIIFDNDYQPDPSFFAGNSWKPCWTGGPGWSSSTDGREFNFAGKGAGELNFAGDDREDRSRFLPIYAYNLHPGRMDVPPYDERVDVNYDLQLSAVYQPQSEGSRISLQTSSFNDVHQIVLSADGTLVLRHGLLEEPANGQAGVRWDEKPVETVKIPPLKVAQEYQLALTYAEHALTFWIDGKCVLRGPQKPGDQAYAQTKSRLASPGALPTPRVAIAAQEGPCRLRHLRLEGDAYYTSPSLRGGARGQGTNGNPIVLRKFLNNSDLDEFFVLGDNSPNSLDGRLWETQAPTLREGYHMGTVPRYNMIGKAFFVYWPGGYRLPFYPSLPLAPNVGRMRLIR
jgi:signal peptidase I